MKKCISPIMILVMSATLTACSSSSVPETSSSVAFEKESSSVFEESTNQSETFSIASSEEPSSQSESDETIAESSVVESLQSPSEAFISDVSAAISGSVTTGKESISGITLENRDLCVSVLISDPSPLTYEDTMLVRTSSITDSILSLENYFDLWDTITVDFGEHGYIQNSQNNIHDDGYGAYFSQSDFVIQHH